MFETGQTGSGNYRSARDFRTGRHGEIERVCREVIEKNPDNVAKFRGGNEGVFKFFVGQVMRATRGQADPQAVNDTLRRLLAGSHE